MNNINPIAAIGATLQNTTPSAIAGHVFNDENGELKNCTSENPSGCAHILLLVIVFLIVTLILIVCCVINVYVLDENGNTKSMQDWRENPDVKIEMPPKEEDQFQRFQNMFVRYEEKILPKKYQNRPIDPSIWFDFNRDNSIWFNIPKNDSSKKSIRFVEMETMKIDKSETLQEDNYKSQEVLKKNQNTEELSIVMQVQQECILNTG